MRKIFDLGAGKLDIFPIFYWEWAQNEGCKESWIYCFRNHQPWDCDRAKILNSFMWTRKR